MSHVLLQYAPEDHEFAHHLAVQLEQRGVVVWPVPDPTLPAEEAEPPDDGLAEASHVLVVLSSRSAAAGREPHWAEVPADGPQVIVVVCDACTVPDALAAYPAVNFEGQFLLGYEELVRLLRKAHAPTRPLTAEYALPVSKADLLPIRMPAERCWRDDRLRINYHLPIVLTAEELHTRIPPFFEQADFELSRVDDKLVRGQRLRRFALFDPRRAEHTITVRRKRGALRVYYRMTRLQAFYWFPAHYRVLDREAAALYRYLVTGVVEPGLFAPVDRQARLARLLSWGILVAFWLVLALLIYLVAI